MNNPLPLTCTEPASQAIRPLSRTNKPLISGEVVFTASATEAKMSMLADTTVLAVTGSR
jgi:hypothetical protein